MIRCSDRSAALVGPITAKRTAPSHHLAIAPSLSDSYDPGHGLWRFYGEAEPLVRPPQYSGPLAGPASHGCGSPSHSPQTPSTTHTTASTPMRVTAIWLCAGDHSARAAAGQAPLTG